MAESDVDKHDYQAALQKSLAHALDHFRTLDDRSVSATASRQTLYERIGKPLPVHGTDPGVVVDELAAAVAGGLNLSSGGRFFGWVVGGSVPAAVGADWLTSAWDQNASLFSCAPACSVVEEVCGGWLKEMLGLPSGASFAFVTGCQMAHATCLAAARHALLHKSGWDVERDGLSGGPQIRIVAAESRHGSIERAARLLGLGSNCIVDLPTDEHNQLPTKALERELMSRSDAPTIVVLQAGDINTGAFDSFAELIPIARRLGAWVHVDGAFGLWANVSPAFRHLLRGVELADSWATDGHKWLNVPYDSGIAFVADANAHRAAMSHRAAYLTHDSDAYDAIDWTPEWSRRCRGMAVYAAIRQLGVSGIAALVERTCGFANDLVTRIGELPGAEVACPPHLNQGLVRFLSSEANASMEDHDRFTDSVIERIVRSGEAFFTGTVWRGRRYMRVSVCNWMTSATDVDRAVRAAREALDECRGPC